MGDGLRPDAARPGREIAAERGARLVVAPPDAGVPLHAARRLPAPQLRAAPAARPRPSSAPARRRPPSRAAAAAVTVPGRLQVVGRAPADDPRRRAQPGRAWRRWPTRCAASIGGRRLVAVRVDPRRQGRRGDARAPCCRCAASVVFTGRRNPRALPPATLESLARQLGGPPARVDRRPARGAGARATSSPGRTAPCSPPARSTWSPTCCASPGGPRASALMNDDGPSVLAMIGLVAAVVALVILVFFGIGYLFGRALPVGADGYRLAPIRMVPLSRLRHRQRRAQHRRQAPGPRSSSSSGWRSSAGPFADARRRIDDPMLVGCATRAASLFPFVGTIVYMIVRPPEYLDDVRERELEMPGRRGAPARARRARCARTATTRSSATSCAARAACASSRTRATRARSRSTRAGRICPYCEAEHPGASRPPATPAASRAAERPRPSRPRRRPS